MLKFFIFNKYKGLKMIYGYVRVSSDKQTTENQIFEIKTFVKYNNITIDIWINETISGVTDIKKRKLGRLLNKMKKGDILISSELSRLGRNLLQVMSILAYCMEHEIAVWTIKDNYRLGMDIQSKIMAFAFGLSAEIERNLISQRTKEALARLKSEGRSLGRPQGTLKAQTLLKANQETIMKYLKLNVPYKQIAEQYRISTKSLQRFLKKNNIRY